MNWAVTDRRVSGEDELTPLTPSTIESTQKHDRQNRETQTQVKDRQDTIHPTDNIHPQPGLGSLYMHVLSYGSSGTLSVPFLEFGSSSLQISPLDFSRGSGGSMSQIPMPFTIAVPMVPKQSLMQRATTMTILLNSFHN